MGENEFGRSPLVPVLKPYMGVKLIMAAPCEKDGKDGYRVVYPDGYESWSPKEAFESAYISLGNDGTRITPPVVDRFIAEVSPTRVDPKTCLVKAEMVTGFTQYKTAACVSPENYDEKIGTDIAMKSIKDDLWFALGFVLQWARFGLNKVVVKREGDA